ncbi:hypothetical protein P7C71_g5891, partial [Lecanoromycetidae sp. Uapishka_2]
MSPPSGKDASKEQEDKSARGDSSNPVVSEEDQKKASDDQKTASNDVLEGYRNRRQKRATTGEELDKKLSRAEDKGGNGGEGGSKS